GLTASEKQPLHTLTGYGISKEISTVERSSTRILARFHDLGPRIKHGLTDVWGHSRSRSGTKRSARSCCLSLNRTGADKRPPMWRIIVANPAGCRVGRPTGQS